MAAATITGIVGGLTTSWMTKASQIDPAAARDLGEVTDHPFGGSGKRVRMPCRV